MKTFLLSVAVLSLDAISYAKDFRAEETSASASGVISAAPPARYALKNRSSFGLATDSHVPFWPIGWTKSATPNPSNHKLEPKLFVVTSVLPGVESIAIIAGQPVALGEQLVVEIDQQTYSLLVKEIREDGVVLQHAQSAPMWVPLRRQDVYVPKALEQIPGKKSVIKLR